MDFDLHKYMHFIAAQGWAKVLNAEYRLMCQRGPWDSVELPLGELSPSYVPFLPKHFNIIHHELGQRGTEEDLEYIWLRLQIRLVYLSTSHPLLLLYLLSFLSRRPQLCHSCLLSCFPSDKTVYADQPQRCQTERI